VLDLFEGWILSFFLFFFFKFYYCCTGGTLWHLQKFLQCIIVEFTPPSLSFIPSPSTQLFIHMRNSLQVPVTGWPRYGGSWPGRQKTQRQRLWVGDWELGWSLKGSQADVLACCETFSGMFWHDVVRKTFSETYFFPSAFDDLLFFCLIS
jgi:hypothetical protein